MNPLRIDVEGRLATLTLNRPEKRNALDRALVDALRGALRNLAGDGAVRAIVLTGAGTAFSAGADLDELRRMRGASVAENRADSRRLGRLLYELATHPKPVIARINGHALAGGCGLAAACDLAVAVEHAKLGFPEVRIGFVPALVAAFVRRRVGEGNARLLLLTGRAVGAREAERMGLVTRSVGAEELDDAVRELVRDLTVETSGTAVRLTKDLLARQTGMSLEDALADGAESNAAARATADCRDGVDAFLAKTDPPWRTLH